MVQMAVVVWAAAAVLWLHVGHEPILILINATQQAAVAADVAAKAEKPEVLAEVLLVLLSVPIQQRPIPLAFI